MKQLLIYPAGNALQKQIRIGTQSKLWTVLPCLQPMAIDNIVQWLPVVESFITVRDVGPNCTAQTRTHKCLKSCVHTWNSGQLLGVLGIVGIFTVVVAVINNFQITFLLPAYP